MKQLLLLTLLSVYHSSIAQREQPVVIPNQYIVVLKELVATPVLKSGIGTARQPNAPNRELRSQTLKKIIGLQQQLGISMSGILNTYTDAIVGFSARLSATEVTALKNNPSVQGIYSDYEIRLSDVIHHNPRPVSPVQVEDCAVTTAGGHTDGSAKPTWIWILDTGIDLDHPDLNVQTYAPYAASFTGEPLDDLNGHGTHVAGIAAAKDNGIGVVGVSAGAKVVPVKVLFNNGNGQASWLIAALDHVAQYAIPGDVINMSLGYPLADCAASFPGILNAVETLADAGVWTCVAAGNSTDNSQFLMPACINNKRVFTVAALDCGNTCATYTSIGNNVDWYAVGSQVYSTYLNGGYHTLSGTSMATPVVAGIIHARGGQAPVRGNNITCTIAPGGTTITLTKPLAKRQ